MSVGSQTTSLRFVNLATNQKVLNTPNNMERKDMGKSRFRRNNPFNKLTKVTRMMTLCLVNTPSQHNEKNKSLSDFQWVTNQSRD